MLVSIYMTRDPLTVGPDDDATVAVRLMARRDVRCLPVAERGRLRGLLSNTDLHGLSATSRNPFSPEGRAQASLGVRVRDVMSTQVVTVGPGDSIDSAVGLLDLHKVNVLVVVDRGEVVGVLSRSDILRAFRDIVFAPTSTRMSLLVQGDVDVIGRLLRSDGFRRLRLRAYAEHPHAGERLVELALEGPADAVDEVLDRAWGGGVRVLHLRRPSVRPK